MTPSAPSLGLSQIGQIAIIVHDVERAVAFYRDTLGLPFLFQPGPGLAFFDASGVRLMLTLPSAPELDHPSSILYFQVADLAAAHATLAQRGVEILHPPRLTARLSDHELWLCFFKDSEGNMLALMSEVRSG
ncbi:MAG TPA: VOC family protein [Thermoanaerobaculia bacterium]|nr:VOC family protein [Thermoanaerobaculia bacterium]